MVKQLLTYKGRILRHYADNLDFDSTGQGAFLTFSGTYSELVNKLRIKYFESNSNLYFTTTEGIKKISATSASDFTTNANYITDAGGVKAVGLLAKIKPNAAGWLPAQSKAAYRLVWAIKDANNNVIRGVPSSRVIVTNTSQDVNVGERFNATVLAHNSISDMSYFTFNTPNNKFGVWFDTTNSNTPPVGADLLGRQLIKVSIQGLTTNELVAAQLASTLSTISDIEVALDSNTVTITNVDGGDVLDPFQGTVSASAVLISKVYDGQVSLGTPANAELSFVIPGQITSTSYFYELYRTAVVSAQVGLTLENVDPGEEFQKVYEANITDAELSAGQITVEEITPETFREGGAFLYTNPNTGEGILQANESPPIAKDVAVFKNSAFYANTSERHRLQFNLLSVSDFTSGVSKFTVANSNITRSYTFVGIAEIIDFTAVEKSLTVGNSYFVINSAQDRVKYKVWFDKGIIQHGFDSTTDVDDATETITINNHGYANNDKVRFSGTLPTGLSPSTDYYVINRTTNTFQVSAAVGGGAIDLTDAVGTGTVTHTPVEPTVADTVSIRVALQTFPDTAQGSVDAFIEAFTDNGDFVAEDQGGGIIRLFYEDNGEATDPVESSPATGWSFSVFTQGDGEDASLNEVLLSGLVSVGQAIEQTARSLERVINKDPLSPVNAFYLSGANDLPGIMLLEARNLVNDPFYLAVNEDIMAAKFNPEMPVSKEITDILVTGNLFTTSTAHNYFVGAKIYINDNPSGSEVQFKGVYTVATVPSSTTFTVANNLVGINQPSISGITFLSERVSDNSVNPNRIYYSKIGQPEAVPLLNFIDIGPKDRPIQRILALRDSLIVLKEDGVYVLTGNAAPNFFVRLVDSSALTMAPDTAVNLNNLIYVLTTQGVVTVSETGVSVISRNIENRILEIANAKFDYRLTSWGVGSESDRSYILWLPTRTTDQIGTQAYRYNTFTRTWTRWTKPATCGVVNLEDDKIYLGDGSGRPYVLQERKNFERQDYADREIIRGIGADALSKNTVIISSAVDLAAGDVLVQKQYIDINKYNRTLKKLDRDTSLSADYFSTLAIALGGDMAQALTSLSAKLNADGIAAPATSGSNVFTALRDDFNAIMTYLNTPGSGTGFKNYKLANEILYYETLITAVRLADNLLTVNFQTKFLQGEISVFKGIGTKVQYVPQHFGKPEATKHIPDGTFIFDQNNFWSGTVAYSSDQSYDFKEIKFSIKGPGYWGGYSWANATFGGEGNEVPLRTLIPREKARCRYLHVQFTHVNAREKWRLLGVSLEVREVSARGYR